MSHHDERAAPGQRLHERKREMRTTVEFVRDSVGAEVILTTGNDSSRGGIRESCSLYGGRAARGRGTRTLRSHAARLHGRDVCAIGHRDGCARRSRCALAVSCRYSRFGCPTRDWRQIAWFRRLVPANSSTVSWTSGPCAHSFGGIRNGTSRVTPTWTWRAPSRATCS